MKVLIEIDEHNKSVIDRFANGEGSDVLPVNIFLALIESVENGVSIPDNATNEDAIKAMFPNAKIKRGVYGINGTPLICLSMGTRYDVHEMSFVEDFWNAPYKGGE